MPFLRLEDGLELFYDTFPAAPSLSSSASPSSSSSDSSSSPPSSSSARSPLPAPWVLLIHPIFLDSSFAAGYFPALRSFANLVVFDLRSHGRTLAPLLPSVDLYTLAADIAFGLSSLGIERVHILALDGLASEISIRLAALFPDSVQSACLCTLPPSADQGFVQTAFSTVMSSWINPELPEDWEASVSATQWWLYGPRAHQNLDILDDWAGAIIRRYPPCQAVKALGSCVAYVEREPIPPFLAASIKAPLLALHGDHENIYDISTAQQRFSQFPNIPQSSQFKILEGVPLQIFDTHPEKVKECYFPWIQSILREQQAQLPPSPSSSSSMASSIPPKSKTIDMRSGLIRLSKSLNRPEIATRDWTRPSSFYAISREKLKSNQERLDALKIAQASKFSLLGGGAPEKWSGASFDEINPHRFSSRFRSHRGGDVGGYQRAAEELILAITECTADEDLP